ncbi:hypothetical protein RD055328_08320 [Companilactobacillus sp. RD055328]|uniref:phage tail protein n=1 Tax=Companilactobacillus sp. RD055328 TaxID=2916634 RepID=UPI001FC88878|nr:tape measure protein [Companilactobacillus sp. RD055328]GKQ42909.1 hypothetical protein RD055328_08320 [Companilactobacillus sp. RD055328]
MADYQVSATLKATDVNFSSAFENAAKAANGAAKTISGSTDEMGSSTEGTEQKFNNMKSTVLGMAGAFGVFKLASAGISMLKMGVGAAVERMDTMRSANMTMTKGLGMSKNAAHAYTAQLQDMVTGTQFTTSATSKMAAGWMAAGMGAGKTKKTMSALLDTVSGLGGGQAEVESFSRQLQQTASTGRVTTQDLNIMGESVVGLRSEMTKKFYNGDGAKFTKDLEAGKVTADMVSDTVQEMGKRYKGSAKEAAGFAGTLQIMQQKVGAGMQKIIEAIGGGEGAPKILNLMKQAADGVAKGFEAMVPFVVQTMDFIKKMVTAIAPAAKAFGLVFGALGAGLTVMYGFSKATSAVSGGLTLIYKHPVIAVILALATAFMYAYQNIKPFRDFIDGAVKSLGDLASKVPKTIGGIDTLKLAVGSLGSIAGLGVLIAGFMKFKKTIKPVTDATKAVKGPMDALKNTQDVAGKSATSASGGFSKVATSILKIGLGVGLAAAGFGVLAIGIAQVMTAFQGLTTVSSQIVPTFAAIGTGAALMMVNFAVSISAGMPQVVAAFILGIGQLLIQGMALIPQIVAFGMQVILSLLQGIMVNIGQITAIAIQILVNFLNALATGLPQIITSGVNLIVALVNGITANLGRVINAGIDLIFAFIDGIVNAIPKIVDKAMYAVGQFVYGVGYYLGKVLTSGGELIKKFISGIMDGMSGSKNAGKANGNAVMNVLKSIDLVGIGKNVIQGFINGIGSMVGAVGKAVKGVADKAVSGIKGFLGIHSPSRVLFEIGGYTGEGFANGINSMASTVNRASQMLAENALPKIDTKSFAEQFDVINSSFSKMANIGANKLSGTLNVKYEMSENSMQMQQNALLKQIANKSTDMYLDGDTLVGGTQNRMNNALGGAIENESRWSFG